MGPLGVRSPSAALDACLRGELISILSFPFATDLPLTGEERKNRGEDDGGACRDGCGVSAGARGDDNVSSGCAFELAGSLVPFPPILFAGLLEEFCDLRVDLAGVAEFRFCDRRDAGDDILT